MSLVFLSPALVVPPISTTIVGGGPAGLATAIMLAKKGYKSITVLDRLPPPEGAQDEKVWSDAARHYLVGLGGRGQRAVDSIGCWDNVVEPLCSTCVGRKDWSPGSGVDEGVQRIFTDRPYLTRVIPRDRMVACLYEYVKSTYSDAIEIQHGVEVEAVEWSNEGDDRSEVAILKCKPCAAGADDDECAATTEPFERRTTLLIGADGTRRTIANAMEADDAMRGRFGLRKFKVKRFEDTSVRVYKTVPLEFPADWRRDINYSCRTKTVNFDALPTLDGKYCGVLLIKPDDVAAQSLPDVAAAREYMDSTLPMFSPAISDDALSQIIAKPPSRLPVFRYVGPRLHRGTSTALLGDAIHTVKPYFGLGVNSAFEDVSVLSEALDQHESLGAALQTYSSRRAPEARALVELSRSFDRSGLLAFFTFILPLILDGIFHGALPKVFAPNTLAMLQKVDVTFEQIRWRKRLDRAAQVILLGVAGTTISKLVINGVRFVTQLVLGKLGGSAFIVSAPRWLTTAVPFAAVFAVALRMRLKVGKDVADVLAAQKDNGLTKADEQPKPA